MALIKIAGILALTVLLPGCKLREVPCTKEKQDSCRLVQKSLNDNVKLNYFVEETYSFGFIDTYSFTAKDYHEKAYKEIEGMLEGWRPLNFKRAVFVTENAYYKDSLSYDAFNAKITGLANLCLAWMNTNPLTEYPFSDSLNMQKNAAIFHVIKDTIYLMDHVPISNSYQYNFSDFSGSNHWENQFVSELLASGSGNCHSLPYLYKILANELGAQAWLSLAPSHIYLKHRSKKWGWYNTELTSGEFPSDAWIKASGYVTLEAIRNGIYMDTLGQKENIALCAFDLAKGYEAQTGNYADGFILKCCDLVLKHYPNHIGSVIMKAEVLKRNYSLIEPGMKEVKTILAEMQRLYVLALELGYREMPAAMYYAWLNSAKEGKQKFVSQEINRTFKNQ